MRNGLIRESRGSLCRAFTLLELIVVITIIGILSTIVALNTSGILSQSKRKVAIASMRTILDGAEMYRALGRDYPSSIQEMVDARDEMGRPNPIFKEKPIDPWNRDFEYTLVDGSPQVRCLGRDGVEGGEGEDADIVMPAPAGQ